MWARRYVCGCCSPQLMKPSFFARASMELAPAAVTEPTILSEANVFRPVVQPTKFELVINRSALSGITVTQQ